MSDHLPECPQRLDGFRERCICPQLRACEARVLNRYRKSQREVRYAIYMDGVQAARDAVAARLAQMGYDTEDTNPYLAAIDQIITKNSGESYG